MNSRIGPFRSLKDLQDKGDRVRSDVVHLGGRDVKISRFPRGHSHDKDLRNAIGIDPMSFVYEDSDDQQVAYTFSQYWTGTVI